MLLIVASILNFYSRARFSVREISRGHLSLVITLARGLTGGTKVTVRARKSEWKSRFESDSRSIRSRASLDRLLTNSRDIYPRISCREQQNVAKPLILNLIFVMQITVFWNFIPVILFFLRFQQYLIWKTRSFLFFIGKSSGY